MGVVILMWLKGCPRCDGDLYLEYRIDETVVLCLQCGNELTLTQVEDMKAADSLVGASNN